MSRIAPSRSLRTTYAPLAMAIALALAAANSNAATLIIDTTDVGTSPDHCSITDAVTAINNQVAVGGCIAGNGTDDTIDLTHFSVPTTISLTAAAPMTSHALMLSEPATIRGALASGGTPLVTIQRSTVTGTDAFGLISSTSSLAIYGLSLTNGDAGTYSGGAIQAGGALIVHDSVIALNSALIGGGINTLAAAEIKNSIISGNTAGSGGGLLAHGGASLTATTIANNNATDTGDYSGGGGIFASAPIQADTVVFSGNTSASAGGAIYATGGVAVVNSSFSGNSANGGSGGAIMDKIGNVYSTMSTINNNTASANGGGIYSAKASVTNSTITGNEAGTDGGGVQADTFISAYSTIAQNTAAGSGGGVKFVSVGTAQATIIFGNTPDNLVTSGTAALTGQFNLVGVASGGGPSAGVPADTISCDPLLAPLADNGGLTQTMALTGPNGSSPGSCAIDAASSTPPANITTDQRGYARTSGPGTSPKADIGAFEFGSSDPDVIFKDGFGD